MSAFGWVVGNLFVFVSWVLAVGWLLVGWLVVGCLLLIGGLSKANRHDIQYPPAHQTADTRATQTQHDLMCRSCVRCLVCLWILDVTVVGVGEHASDNAVKHVAQVARAIHHSLDSCIRQQGRILCRDPLSDEQACLGGRMLHYELQQRFLLLCTAHG